MTGTRIDDTGQSQLTDAVQSLEQWVTDDVIQQPSGNLDKPKDGVVDYLVLVHVFSRAYGRRLR